jgi:hypothetical protein
MYNGYTYGNAHKDAYSYSYANGYTYGNAHTYRHRDTDRRTDRYTYTYPSPTV